MKTTLRLILAAVVLTTGNTPAADIASTLSVSRSDQGLHLSWPGTVRQADGTVLAVGARADHLAGGPRVAGAVADGGRGQGA